MDFGRMRKTPYELGHAATEIENGLSRSDVFCRA